MPGAYPDIWNVPIRVTEERLRHASRDRRDLLDQEENIAVALREPDVVVQSRKDAKVRLYHRRFENSPVGDKFLCVVVKWVDDAFMLTAFFTSAPKKGRQLWPEIR